MPYDVNQPPVRSRRPVRGGALLAVAALAAACLSGCGGPSGPPEAGAGASPSATATDSPAPRPAGTPPSGDAKPADPGAEAGAGTGPLAGKVVVIDPGHNPGNFRHTREINALVDIGTHRKECDTTGTSTNDGHTEAEFTLDVSHRLRTLLEKQGARVQFTQDNDRPFGPCVDERARIGNKASADAVVSVHADGSGVGNRGFHVILPALVKDGSADTTKIVGPSRELGERIAGTFVRATGSKPSNYVGGGTGLDVRGDLGGLNLSTVPKVFIECGNMRDAKDAALLTSSQWRQKAAQGIADGISTYLLG
ncbi:N-acetylmuramoyl-L-alanine amidase [Streptomyces sp. NPDC059881]|uniref:N-acetylmuramoyl-L-alanine amidase n=1 Tax=Streptomyces sp. NPDC059881 TaxID=3346986 RepID=UPI00365A54A4